MFILYFTKVVYFQEYKHSKATIVGSILWFGPTEENPSVESISDGTMIMLIYLFHWKNYWVYNLDRPPCIMQSELTSSRLWIFCKMKVGQKYFRYFFVLFCACTEAHQPSQCSASSDKELSNLSWIDLSDGSNFQI